MKTAFLAAVAAMTLAGPLLLLDPSCAEAQAPGWRRTTPEDLAFDKDAAECRERGADPEADAGDNAVILGKPQTPQQIDAKFQRTKKFVACMAERGWRKVT
jgi:hypothetical protein